MNVYLFYKLTYISFNTYTIYRLYTDFSHTYAGYWHISVTYDSKHIRGSPFQVRVYDADSVRVYGLENGACGKKFKFTGLLYYSLYTYVCLRIRQYVGSRVPVCVCL